MSAEHLLAELLERGVQLWAEGGNLRFRAPPGVVDPTVKARLSEHKQALLQRLGEGRRLAPAAPGQRRLWLTERLTGGGAYVVALAWRVSGPLDPVRLRQALAAVVARHEALRSGFDTMADTPVQAIHDTAAPDLPVVEAGTELEFHLTEAAEEPFDLTGRSLLRARLFRQQDGSFALLLALHHTVCDARSVALLLQDLAFAYGELSAGRAPLWAQPAASFADLVAAEARRPQDAEEAASERWRRRLAGLAPLQLPADRPRSASGPRRGGRAAFTLPAATTAGLRALARAEGVTPFMLLLAAFALLLGRLSGSEDLALACPITRRAEGAGEAEAIGFRADTLLLRLDLAGDPTVSELLARTRERVREAFGDRALPFERVAEALAAEGLAPDGLTRVLFTHQEAVRGDGSLTLAPGVTLQPFPLVRRSAKADLVLETAETDDGLVGGLEYDADLFDAASARRLLDGFEVLLSALAAAPEARAFALPLERPEAQAERLAAINATARPFPRDSSIPALFQLQAEARPDAPAVIFGEDRLSYRELDRRSAALAALLRRRGVGLDRPVGVFLQRSATMVVAWLAILRAGGAYLPLDPDYPPDRLAFMLQDSGATLVLSDGALAGCLAEAGRETLLLDDPAVWEEPPAPRPSRPLAPVPAEALAYLVYTSGSTGRPKGVAVPHRAVLRLVVNCDYCRIEPRDRVAQVSNASFDAATFEVWGALLSGACLVGVDSETALSPPAFAEALKAGEVTTLFLTTALFNAVVRERPDAFAGITHLLTGGEHHDPELCRRLLAESQPPRRLLNVYGPTETTTFATWYPMASLPPEAPRVPIGRPIANATLYVLDRNLRPVPPLVVGEVWLGGEGVCRGYHGGPALTAERFLPDPFSDRPGARLYRSGDLGRLLPDGSLDLLGRSDDQIKVRGFRVEPREIEIALAALPEVESALVLARTASGGEQRLLAWAVARPLVAVTGSALREALARQLPAHLVPSAIAVLPAWPLTANGKIDRAALPLPGEEAAEGIQGAPPETPLEARIAELWAEVLELPAVGRDQDFFFLGGHSLAAARLLARLRSELGVEVPLRGFFEAPTVAGVAALVDELPARPNAGGGIQRLAPGLPTPLSFAQERLWFLAKLEPEGAHYNVPFALRLRGPLDPGALQRAFAALVARHETLRTAIEEVEGRPVLRQVELLPALPVENLESTELEARLRAEAALPFDLARPPLLRARLFRLGPEEHVLSVCLHHAVCDGWSLGILLRELAALYGEAAGAAPAGLAPLPVRYGDFAAWQRRRLADGDLAPALEQWRQRLEGLAPLALPPDHAAPARPSRGGAVVPFGLARAQLEALKRLAEAEGATLFMVLLAAVGSLLGRWSGQEEGLLGTALAGRDHPEVEPLIGHFVKSLPLRLDLSGTPSVRALIGRAREALLEAEALQEVPFELIVETLQPVRDAAHSPLFRVMVLLQNMPLAASPLPGLTLEPLPLDAGGAKFDLTLSAFETPEGLIGGLEYATDLYEAGTLRTLAACLERLLGAMAASPDLAAASLPLVPPEEGRHPAILGPGAPEPAPFVPAVLIAPGARLEQGDRILETEALRAAVEAFAAELREAGVGPEVVVGLALPPSPERIVALLAILRAGGAWLPLDPALPAARRADFARDAGVGLLVAALGTAAELGLEGMTELQPSLQPPAAPRLPLPPAVVHPDQAAYLLYTSGSTGRPKGMVVTHGALANHMRWMLRALPLDPSDRVVQRTALSFDASVWEVLAPMMAGCTLLLPPAGGPPDARELATFVKATEATVLQVVPTLLAALLEEPDFAACRSLRRLCCGGEALPSDLVRRLRGLHALQVVNLYGPTEATIQTVVESDCGEERAATLPIGRPIDATRAYLLDAGLRPVPPGMPGELHLAGPALARGYRSRPDQTAERFLPDPFSDEPGQRMLATGDRARLRPDGRLEWLGRLDQQVKLRGFRLEPAEIEALLREDPGVADAAVLLRPGPGGPRLVAHLRRTPGTTPDPARLRTALAARLPAYMIPAAWAVHETFPRLPSGKLDRRALPDPAPEAAPGGEAALSPLEQVVAAAFAEVLERPAVGRHEAFFEIGGHSLLAVRAAARLRAALGREVPLALLFEAPTPAALAQRLERNAGERTLPPLRPADREAPLPLSAAQRRLWFLAEVEGGSRYNMVAGIDFQGPLDRPALERTLNALVARHESLRTTFHGTEEGPVQVVQPAFEVPLPLIDCSENGPGEEQARNLAEPFDLVHGPLIRARLLRVAPDRHRLLLMLHHIVSDGWSMALLAGEVAALYQGFRSGGQAGLPPLALHYADFAAWQREARDPARHAEALARAAARLRDAPPLALPLDRPRSADAGWEGAARPLHIGHDRAGRIAATAASAGATSFMLALAAFAATLQRLGAKEDILLGADVADRPLPETEAMIGFFVNQLVLRLDLAGDPTPRSLLERVRARLLEAYADREVGFDELVAALNPERPPGTTPLVQAKVTMQAPLRGAAAPPEGMSFVDVAPGEVPFDLMINLIETPEGITGALLYRRALFETATIERMAGLFERLLDAMAAEPDRPLSTLAIESGGADFRRSGLARLQSRRR